MRNRNSEKCKGEGNERPCDGDPRVATLCRQADRNARRVTWITSQVLFPSGLRMNKLAPRNCLVNRGKPSKMGKGLESETKLVCCRRCRLTTAGSRMARSPFLIQSFLSMPGGAARREGGAAQRDAAAPSKAEKRIPESMPEAC